MPPWVGIETRPELVCGKCGARRSANTTHDDVARFALAHAACDERKFARVEAMLTSRVAEVARLRMLVGRESEAAKLLDDEVAEINRALEALGLLEP